MSTNSCQSIISNWLFKCNDYHNQPITFIYFKLLMVYDHRVTKMNGKTKVKRHEFPVFIKIKNNHSYYY